MLVPRIDEHSVALVVVREDSPHRASRRVTARLLGERTVVRLEDVFKLRQRFVCWPQLEVRGLEDTAGARSRVLLQLTSRAVCAEQLLESGDLFLTKPLRTDEFADFLARVVRAQHSMASLTVPFSGDAYVLPAADVFKDVTADVPLVQTLHNSNHGVGLRVVQSGGPDHVEPLKRGITHSIRLSVLRAMRVVKDEA